MDVVLCFGLDFITFYVSFTSLQKQQQYIFKYIFINFKLFSFKEIIIVNKILINIVRMLFCDIIDL